jgi:hypothetical protein
MTAKDKALKALGKYAEDLSEEELKEFGTDEERSHTWTVTIIDDTEYDVETDSRMKACETAWRTAGMSCERGIAKNGKKKTNLPWDRGLYVKIFKGRKPFVMLGDWKVSRKEPTVDDPLGEDLLVVHSASLS